LRTRNIKNKSPALSEPTSDIFFIQHKAAFRIVHRIPKRVGVTDSINRRLKHTSQRDSFSDQTIEMFKEQIRS